MIVGSVAAKARNDVCLDGAILVTCSDPLHFADYLSRREVRLPRSVKTPSRKQDFLATSGGRVH